MNRVDQGSCPWQEIWERKGASAQERLGLPELLALNGFDTAAGCVGPARWIDYVRAVGDRVGITPGSRVCEVGCGAGAFLLPLYDQGIRPWGVDYAASLLAVCRRALPGGHFAVAEARALPFARATFDIVLSNSVFFYFRDLAYADAALAEIARVLRPGARAALLDINDAAKKDLFVALKRQLLGNKGYARMYTATPHLFYERAWIHERAAAHGLSCAIEDQFLMGYPNAPFRFNVFLSAAD